MVSVSWAWSWSTMRMWSTLPQLSLGPSLLILLCSLLMTLLTVLLPLLALLLSSLDSVFSSLQPCRLYFFSLLLTLSDLQDMHVMRHYLNASNYSKWWTHVSNTTLNKPQTLSNQLIIGIGSQSIVILEEGGKKKRGGGGGGGFKNFQKNLKKKTFLIFFFFFGKGT